MRDSNSPAHISFVNLWAFFLCSLEHTAGLNPKGFRTLRQKWKDLRNPSRGVVDGDLVFKFSSLSVPLKAELARKIGTSAEEIMEDLAELDRSAAHF